jgi:hypothetical protein
MRDGIIIRIFIKINNNIWLRDNNIKIIKIILLEFNFYNHNQLLCIQINL